MARTDIKVDLCCLVDGGSAVNIMPWLTMKKLWLKFCGPSTVNITMADQRNVQPEGMIKKT